MKRLSKEKMVVYEVVERKEPERDYWWFGPLMFAVFIMAPLIWLLWWKGILDFSRVTS